METAGKLIAAALAAAVLPAWSAGRANAWAGHSVICEAFGADAASLTCDIPDTWGDSHFGRERLAERVRFWTAKARRLSSRNPKKDIYAGYALHYLGDAGQPWHIYRDGDTKGDIKDNIDGHIKDDVKGDLENWTHSGRIPDVKEGLEDWTNNGHIPYEVHVAKRYPSYRKTIAGGARDRVAITSDGDAYDKTIKLAEAVNDFYPYLDSKKNWTANSEYTGKALRYVGQYGAGLVQYIMASPESADDKPSCKPGQVPCRPAAWEPVRSGTDLSPLLNPFPLSRFGNISDLKTGDPVADYSRSTPPEPEILPEESRKTGFLSRVKDFFQRFF